MHPRIGSYYASYYFSVIKIIVHYSYITVLKVRQFHRTISQSYIELNILSVKHTQWKYVRVSNITGIKQHQKPLTV